jgi:hypothetical protein
MKQEKAQPGIYAIVLNWNRPDDTLACVESLLAQDTIQPYIVVVDNASQDDSVERIRQHYPAITLLINDSNLGFARGCNVGIRHALAEKADFVFLINNDAVLAPDGLKQLLEHADEKTGIVAPLIYYATPADVIWSMGGKVNPILLEKSNDAANQKDPGNWPEVIEQDFVTGCGMLIPRRALETVGMFDESFPMYYEDSDLCLRMRKAGWRVRVVPSSHMWHKVSSSSGGTASPKYLYAITKASIHFFCKHAQWWQAPWIFLYRLGSAIKKSLTLIRQGHTAGLQAYWQGVWDGFLSQRTGPQERIHVSS